MKKGKTKKMPTKGVNRVAKPSDSENESIDGEDIFTDEISEFTESRNKVDLTGKEEESEDEEGLFNLGSDSAESDEELGQWAKRLKQIKFQTKRDKQKGLPDAPEKSWGKKRTDFYGSGVRRKPKDTGEEEEDEWLMEEKEIHKLQQRLDEDIDTEDFLVPALTMKPGGKASQLKVKRDVTAKVMDKYQGHPEVEPLREELNLCLEKVGKLKGCGGRMMESKDAANRLLGANIAFYLHLLESGEDTRGHPVLKRIIQWKKLAKIFDTIPDDEDKYSEQLSSNYEDQENQSLVAKKPRLLAENSDEDQSPGDSDEGDENFLQNRPVTYEIEKNKARKKSAPNNPRVKHREKFRKAKIRRKGKIREHRPEVTKYQGEISGIRTGIVRSVRLN